MQRIFLTHDSQGAKHMEQKPVQQFDARQNMRFAMAIGIAIGAAISAAQNNLVIGVALGAALIGMAISWRNNR